MKTKFKLYSGDGGGCFGAIPAYLNMAYDRVNDFDGFIGTSIHSALCSGYALGVDADKIYRFMSDDMSKVFHRSWLWALKPYGPKWPDDGLNEAIKKLVGEKTLLKDVPKPLFITAMNFKHDTPKVFTNMDEEDQDIPLWEVIRCSVAANTYFPLWCPYVVKTDFFADGGTWANTPSMAGLAAIKSKMDYPLSKIHIFSVGCGATPDPKRNKDSVNRWTSLRMGLTTLDSMFEGGNERAMSYMARSVIGKRYVRFNRVKLDSGWKMDDPSLIPEMRIRAEALIDEYQLAIDKVLNG